MAAASFDHKENCSLAENFRGLLEDGSIADIVIDVEGKTIKAHKAILYARSGFFRSVKSNRIAPDWMHMLVCVSLQEAFERPENRIIRSKGLGSAESGHLRENPRFYLHGRPRRGGARGRAARNAGRGFFFRGQRNGGRAHRSLQGEDGQLKTVRSPAARIRVYI